METIADQMIMDGLRTRADYEQIRSDLAKQITIARVLNDYRKTVILCTRFINAFPLPLAPIERAVRDTFHNIRNQAREELKRTCPVCKSTTYDITCPDDIVRSYCAKCGRTYTPMGYMDDDNYALKWFAKTWDGGSEPSEVIVVI